MTGPDPADGGPAADPPRDPPEVVTALTHAPLDVGAAYAAVTHPQAGGVGVFVGVVRDHHAGARVSGLAYEAWEERATDDLDRVARAVAARFGGVRTVYAAHRLGRLAIGDASVVVAVSAPHRDEALAATHALIDDIKAGVAIWKREELVDGSHRWPGTDAPA